MLVELKKLIEANPLFRDKLQFPTLRNSRLRTLINQRFIALSLNLFVLFTSSCCWHINSFYLLLLHNSQLKLATPAL